MRNYEIWGNRTHLAIRGCSEQFYRVAKIGTIFRHDGKLCEVYTNSEIYADYTVNVRLLNTNKR